MGPYQRTPKEVARAIKYSGLRVRSVDPIGDFLEKYTPLKINAMEPKSHEGLEDYLIYILPNR